MHMCLVLFQGSPNHNDMTVHTYVYLVSYIYMRVPFPYPSLPPSLPAVYRLYAGSEEFHGERVWSIPHYQRVILNLQSLHVHLPLLVLKARHLYLSNSTFYKGFSRVEVPEQVLDGIPLSLGLDIQISLLS